MQYVLFIGNDTTMIKLSLSNKIIKSLLSLCVFIGGMNFTNAQTIHTFAGTGIPVYTVFGVPATSADIGSYPFGVKADGLGNLYIAAIYHILKVNTAGIITSIAGTGINGFSGDGGPATAAMIGGTDDVAVDALGNVFFTDVTNNRVRKIDPSGIISTFAGNGTTGGYSGDGGPATATCLSAMHGITVDASGNVYIAHVSSARIRIVNTAGIISTFAGNGGLGHSGDGGPATAAAIGIPEYLTFDGAGNLYFTDLSNNVVRKINSSGIISTIAGLGTAGYSGDGGPATAAELNGAMGIAIDGAGNVFVGDNNNNRVRKINASGIISTYAGNGTPAFGGDGGVATAAMLKKPQGVATDGAGNLYISDVYNWRIRIVNPASTPTFDGGSPQSLAVCENSLANSINSLLTITDTASSLTETFSVTVAPTHGAIAAGSTVISGTSVSPIGWAYTPASGYSGIDSFRIQVDNNANTSVTLVIVTVNPLPSAGPITGTTSVCVGSATTLSDITSGGTWTSSSSGLVALSGSAGTSTTATGVTTGTDTVFYTVTNSCGTAVASLIVSVFDVPVVAAIAGADTACLSSPTTLTNTTSGGSWISSRPSVATISSTGLVTPLSTGTDTIHYSVSNSCGSTSVTHLIVIDSLPAVSPFGGPETVCKGATSLFTDVTPGGVWSSSTHASIGSASGLLTGLSVGLDTVTYTVTNSCGAAAVRYVISIINCHNAGASNMSGLVSGVVLTPNPSDGLFTLKLLYPTSQNSLITIIDMSGKKINSFKLPTNIEHQIDQKLPAGNYLISASVNTETFTARLVIE